MIAHSTSTVGGLSRDVSLFLTFHSIQARQCRHTNINQRACPASALIFATKHYPIPHITAAFSMWLLSTSFTKDRGERPWSGMKLEEFFGSQIPPYAILSHTWGTEEITFQDIASSSLSPSHKAGFAKLEGCCTRAAQDGYDYVWIDTCWYVKDIMFLL